MIVETTALKDIFLHLCALVRLREEKMEMNNLERTD